MKSVTQKLLARYFGRTGATIAIALLLAGVANACPTCKEGLAQNDPQGQSIAAGYYYSIIFMMSMPYIVLSTFISAAYLSIRRARKQTEAMAAGPNVEGASSPPGDVPAS
jgi:hypothetical protein